MDAASAFGLAMVFAVITSIYVTHRNRTAEKKANEYIRLTRRESEEVNAERIKGMEW